MDTKRTELENLTYLLKFLPGVFSAVSFLGGMIVSVIAGSFWFNKNVATVPYVNEKHDEALKYSERLAIEFRQQAFDHSELNKKDMMNEVKAQSADIRAMGAKQDILLDSVRTIQNRMYDLKKR